MHGEFILRLAFFLSLLVSLAAFEQLAPRRNQAGRTWMQRLNNLLLIAVDSLCIRLVAPLALTGIALQAEQSGWGLFNRIAFPGWLAGAVSFLLLDMLIYAQHVAFHKVPLLWRMHRVHHSDTGIDVTTGVRFHPFEMLISLGIKALAVILLGVPAIAVLIFEIALNATSLFNHSNIAIPVGLDRLLRLMLVTPDMHRVHHSIVRRETDSNFGFNLPWWDRLFGTYRNQPEAGHPDMTLGLPEFRDRRSVGIHWLLAQPFLKVNSD
jgi:sterol desaturase/sphingolipid hydroxylase (fatty acid hydroxylase superfamily)